MCFLLIFLGVWNGLIGFTLFLMGTIQFSVQFSYIRFSTFLNELITKTEVPLYLQICFAAYEDLLHAFNHINDLWYISGVKSKNSTDCDKVGIVDRCVFVSQKQSLNLTLQGLSSEAHKNNYTWVLRTTLSLTNIALLWYKINKNLVSKRIKSKQWCIKWEQ